MHKKRTSLSKIWIVRVINTDLLKFLQTTLLKLEFNKEKYRFQIIRSFGRLKSSRLI